MGGHTYLSFQILSFRHVLFSFPFEWSILSGETRDVGGDQVLEKSKKDRQALDSSFIYC